MKLTLLGLDFKLEKTTRRNGLSMTDIHAFNDDQLENIRALESGDIQGRMVDISLDALDTEDQVAMGRKIIQKYGILVVPNYINNAFIDRLQLDIGNIYNEYIEKLDDSIYEDFQTLVQKERAKISGYKNLANYSKPIIQVRQGQDEGMVDIFNVDGLNGVDAQLLRDGLESEGLQRILSSGRCDLAARNLNCYINESITKTRGFHADTYIKKLKAFVYLTDVKSLDDGPYTYVKSTHQESAYRRVNKVISRTLPKKTEAPLVNFLDVVPIIAPKGSLVISDQSGFHRGFPQAKGKKRMVAVMNYQ